MKTVTSEADRPQVKDEAPYHAFLAGVQTRFATLTHGQTLFTVGVEGPALWAIYLDSIPAKTRQHNTCHSCRHFIERFGNLALVAEDGTLMSPIWDEALATPELAASVKKCRLAVEKAKVNGIFLSSDKTWGTPQTGVWRHLAVCPNGAVYKERLLNAGQRMAELREDFRCLQAALDEFKPEALKQARTLWAADALSRSERFLGPVTWLESRHADRKAKNANVRTNLLWRAVATAPAGFCKPRGGMIGTLLEDLISGMPFEDVRRRFDAKMHPLQYQRPQAPPSAGNIRQAEEAFEKLGLASALDRRFATMADVLEWTWRPADPKADAPGEGVFGHLKANGKQPSRMELPQKTMTWAKFRDTVLSGAEKIELIVPYSSHAFSAFVTAVDPEAPPLLQWDREDRRNPVSWYFYHGGSTARQWGLANGAVQVVGITPKPCQWQDGFAYQGDAAMFVLEGARDSRNDSLALFPETLRAELHGVRSTLEAHSRSRSLQPVEGQLASGMMFGKDGASWSDLQLRVTTAESVSTYRVDRWD
jgi:hypothetical protein